MITKTKNQNKTEYFALLHFCRHCVLGLVLPSGANANSGCMTGNSALAGAQLLSQTAAPELLGIKRLLHHNMISLITFWLTQAALEVEVHSGIQKPEKEVVLKQILWWVLQRY